jgi:uncharacterized membrane protein
MLPILNQSFWRDEAFSVLLAQKNPLDIIRLASQDVSPGFLHYLLLHYWMLVFGVSEVSARGMSFLFHILTVFGMFLCSRKLIKSPVAQLLITLATLLNPFLLYYAFEARPYSLLACLTVFTVYFIICRRFIVASVFLALAILTHEFGLFTLIAILTWACFTFGRTKRAIQEHKQVFIELFLFPIGMSIVLASVIYSQWTKVASGFWIKQATSTMFIHSFEVYTRGESSYQIQLMCCPVHSKIDTTGSRRTTRGIKKSQT